MIARNMIARKLNRSAVLLAAVVAALLAAPAAPVAANGIIICPRPHPHPPHPPQMPIPVPRPIREWTPFQIKSQRVDIAIRDTVAETTIEQVFVNRSPRPAEGTYMFPIAEDAAVHSFTLWMNGREVNGELLDADKARSIYESIVSKMRDPALLQFAGCGLIEAKVFPIPAGGECRIKLTYSRRLRSDAGLATYRFPLGTSACDRRPIERFSLRAVVRSSQPLTSIFSPSHDCSFDRRGEHEAVVGLERSNLLPETDFQLFFKTGNEAFGLALLTHRLPGREGFFMARVAPRVGGDRDAAIPKNICFVLDTSGSMADDNKIAQAKRALNFCITNLGGEDRFNLITFATEVRPFSDQWSTPDEDERRAVTTFIRDLKAVGGTDISGALRRALELNPRPNILGSTRPAGGEAWRNNPYYIVFITDGEPTVGETNPDRIVQAVRNANTAGAGAARIFALGIGHKLNTKLLDRLADDNGGARDYVTPGEDLELKLSAFYTKLAHPVLTGVKLAFRALSVHDVYPRKLPDLFRGSELVVLGRYGGTGLGTRTVELTGTRRGEPLAIQYPGSFPDEQRENDFLPRLWAVQKIGHLLDELRLHGENKELKDEVIRLAKQYGILTPYTSFLVHEDEKIAQRRGRLPVGGGPLRLAATEALDLRRADMNGAAAGFDAETGAGAVQASARGKKLRLASGRGGDRFLGEIQSFLKDKAGARLVRFVGAKTFYRDGRRWIDAEYDGKTQPTALRAYTAEYFAVLIGHPEAGRYLALGERIVLCLDGRTYEIAPDW